MMRLGENVGVCTQLGENVGVSSGLYVFRKMQLEVIASKNARTQLGTPAYLGKYLGKYRRSLETSVLACCETAVPTTARAASSCLDGDRSELKLELAWEEWSRGRSEGKIQTFGWELARGRSGAAGERKEEEEEEELVGGGRTCTSEWIGCTVAGTEQSRPWEDWVGGRGADREDGR